MGPTIVSHPCGIKTVRPGDDDFVISDGLVVASRAGVEISGDMPKEYKAIVFESLKRGWIKPVASIPINNQKEPVSKGNPMKGWQLSNMLQIATQRHDGQFDKGGNPYILHALKVMHYTRSQDEEVQCVALGHDVIEDTFDDPYQGKIFLGAHGFSQRVIDGIWAMTKLPGQSYEEYKEAVKANDDAVVVKMADLRHNTDIRRLKGVTEKDVQRMTRYHQFYLELRDVAKQRGLGSF